MQRKKRLVLFLAGIAGLIGIYLLLSDPAAGKESASMPEGSDVGKKDIGKNDAGKKEGGAKSTATELAKDNPPRRTELRSGPGRLELKIHRADNKMLAIIKKRGIPIIFCAFP